MNRTGKYGINAALTLVFAIGAAVMIQAISANHAKRFDLTRAKDFTLSEQTAKVLATLDGKLELLCFYKDTQEELEAMQDMMKQYAAQSGQVSYRVLDPDRNKALATKYAVTSYGAIVAKYKGRTQTVKTLAEQDVTNAILKLAQGRTKKIYLTTGHGEKAPETADETGYSNIASALEAENFSYAPLLLMRAAAVPADCDLLLVAGPKKDFLAEELEAIRDYIFSGGRAVIMLDPQTAPETSAFMAKTFGITVGDNVVVDPVSKVFGGDYLIPVVTQYAPHPITRGFQVASFFPLSRALDISPEPVPGVAAAAFAMTSKGSWAETDLKTLEAGSVEFDEKTDRPGPLTLAIAAVVSRPAQKAQTRPEADMEADTAANPEEAAEIPAAKEDDAQAPAEGRLVVFGDSDFADNSYFSVSGNKDIFINSVRWLCNEENLISIRPRERKNEPLILTPGQVRNIFVFSIFLIPMCVVFTGVLVYRTRKSRNETA